MEFSTPAPMILQKNTTKANHKVGPWVKAIADSCSLYIYLYETASTTGQYFVGAERQG
jgi:hypothetical protein